MLAPKEKPSKVLPCKPATNARDLEEQKKSLGEAGEQADCDMIFSPPKRGESSGKLVMTTTNTTTDGAVSGAQPGTEDSSLGLSSPAASSMQSLSSGPKQSSQSVNHELHHHLEATRQIIIKKMESAGHLMSHEARHEHEQDLALITSLLTENTPLRAGLEFHKRTAVKTPRSEK